jgi:hypothetical protein
MYGLASVNLADQRGDVSGVHIRAGR